MEISMKNVWLSVTEEFVVGHRGHLSTRKQCGGTRQSCL